MKKILLASAGVLALSAMLPVAASADVSGTLSGSYANDTDGGSDGLWNLGGSLTGTFAPDWGAEVTGGYHSFDVGAGSNLDIWNVGGSVFWSGMQGRLAGTVNYYSTSNSGLDLNVTSYGAGGEWYLGPNFTVAVKGGGNNVSGYGSNQNGGYAGGMLQWYLMPDLSLSGAVDYNELAGLDTTAETARVEWLFSHTMPISIYGGYEHEDINLSGTSGSGGNGNLFFVGLKFYFNGSTGGGSLVDRQRNGSLGYIADTPVLGLSTN